MPDWNKKRTTAILLAILLVLTVPTIVYAVTFTVHIDSDVTFNASASGPEVTFDQALDLEDSKNPFEDANTINISSSQGNITLTATGKASAHITQIEGTWTNLSQIDTSSADLTIDPNDKQNVTVGGGASQLKFRSMTSNDDTSDFWYTAPSSPMTLEITQLSANTQLGAIDVDTNEALDSAETDASGTLTFTDLETGTHTVELESLGSLEIRNETNESQLINDRELQVTFYATDGFPIDERTTTTGIVDMTGLPVDEAFVAVVRDTQGDYIQRSVYIDDLSQQADIFLLNDTQFTSVTVEFQTQDQTGEFPPDESFIKIQKALNSSLFTDDQEDNRWVTMSGDVVGSDEALTAHLKLNDRYRIVIENEDGDITVLGEYTAEGDAVEQLRIGTRIYDLTPDEGTYEYSANLTESGGNEFVQFAFNDPEDKTTDLRVIIHERGNESNQIFDQTFPGPHGSVSVSQQVPAASEGSEWVVDWNASHQDLDDEIGSEFVVGQEFVSPGIPLNSDYKGVISLSSTLLFASWFGGRVNARIGAASIPAFAATWYYLGWMPTEITVGLVILTLFIGGVSYANSSSGGI